MTEHSGEIIDPDESAIAKEMAACRKANAEPSGQTGAWPPIAR
jgi:hypothetical protein